MYASRSRFPKEQDQQRGHDVVPFAAKDWPPEAVRDLDEPGRARRRAGPSMRPARSAADEPEVNTASARPSFGRRVIRGLFRFVIAVMIGVGLTLGLQMHGHEVRDAARIWAPAVASLLDGLLPVIASTNSGASTVAAPATFADLVQQVGPLQQDLAGVRRSIDELAARQDQLVQAIAALQAAGQDLRQKQLTPPPPAQPPASAAPHRAPQPKAQSSSAQSSSAQQGLPPSAGPPPPWPTAR